MTRSLLANDDYKLQFAGHETFPLRYGWLKKAYDAVSEQLRVDSATGASVFLDDAAIARFGVGKNMVLSMRHWALATDILSSHDAPGERTSRVTLGPIGDLLFGESNDPFLEHPGSLWLLHWTLASRPGRASAWHWAFNEFHEPAFDRELMTRRLVRRCEELQESGRLSRDRPIAGVTLKRDVECIIRTYHAAAAGGRRAPEDSIESPLAELGLIQKAGVGEQYRFRRGPKPSLPDEVFLYALIDFWRTLFDTRRSFSVDFLTFERGSPGQVFLLDEDAVAERLVRLDDLTGGALRWDESSGMRQLYAPGLEQLQADAVLRAMYARDMGRLAA
ncbi:hypothetical protein GGQ87_001304 [Brevundimonas alba]|uniref:DUF4007 domain-containing protein n=1 Tax=Brevundimonas alba TaxID=74314 RepID=A0A7X6BP16_9CAUL|nr:DUF4007 family protein [Brevundimonas alba]NJC41046.1 hypothetical protein [Brevundimonas alba]